MAKRRFLGRHNEVDIRHIPDGTWLDCAPDDAFAPVSSVRPSVALTAHREDIRRIVAARGGRNPRVFGSVLSGEDTVHSDLDILVDPMPGVGGFRFYGIATELENLLKVKVDVLSPKDLPKRFRQAVLAEAVPV